MSARHLLAAAALAACCLPAAAQNLKPGLWEFNNRVQGEAGGQVDQAQAQMRAQMAAMPPEQRKMVEEMMAKQGVRMGAGGPGGGMAVQVCMTREMVEKNDIPMSKSDCKVTSQSRSGNTMKIAFACSSPPSSGEGTYTFISPDAYSSKMMVKTVVNGKPETMNMDGSGKWLSADCGNVKPLVAPK